MKLAAVTLDVDGVRHYHAIHGLPVVDGEDPPLERGVRRFLDLCESLDIKSTIFVVTADLEDDGLRTMLARAARDGHEIASHSHGHAYDLSRHAPAAIDADLHRSVEAIERLTGRRPRGFRAPGYNLSEALLDAVERAGFAYDSSVMPSPLYWAARAIVIGAHELRRRSPRNDVMGKPSSSLVGQARAFATSRDPYRPRKGAHHKQARSRIDGRALVELPIATMPFGLPWLGTTVGMSPLPLGAMSTAVALSSKAPCVLELHAIDLCDAQDGFADALVRVQRELAVPLEKKVRRLESALRMIAQARDVVTLDEIARAHS